ncbi:MAG: hypothetical protein ACLQBL_18290, partial [Polyangiaceae bacterium]
MSRPVKGSFRSSDDDAQTTFMSRALVPASSRSPLSGRRAPVFTEERTLIDVPRPVDASEERTIVAPLSFPKAAPRATLTIPRTPRSSSPAVAKSTPPSVRPVPRASQPPPLPPAPLPSSPPPPVLVPPPPPSATKLLDAPVAAPLPSSPPPPASFPSTQSSPALVRDLTPSTFPPPPASHPARDPMILIAAALGVLGIIFTMGIVVGLVVSLRSHDGAAGVDPDTHTSTIAAAAGAALVPALPAAPSAPAPVVVPSAPVVKVVPTKIAPAEGIADSLLAPKPPAAAIPAPVPAVRVARAAPVAAAAPVVKPAPVTPPAKRGRASSGDPDMDAANAASELAKAQLDASL